MSTALDDPSQGSEPQQAKDVELASLLSSAEQCPSMKLVLGQLQRLSTDLRPVCIHGELGSGRRSAAFALHALSDNRTRPVYTTHKNEITHILNLYLQGLSSGAEESEPTLLAREMLGELLRTAQGGTLIFEEGPRTDWVLQELLSEVLALRPQVRVVFLCSAPLLTQRLKARLSSRIVAIPPLRERREEFSHLVSLLLARKQDRGALPVLKEDALVFLQAMPFYGNLRQLGHLLAWLVRGAQGATLSAADLPAFLPGQAFHGEGGTLRDGAGLASLASALGDVLRVIVPVLSEIPSADNAPRAPLYLIQESEAHPDRSRLILGTTPMDEHRLVMGLQARPKGPSGMRTGDAPALTKLGTTWRGHLLSLLRATHTVLAQGQSESISLGTLARLLLLSGPPLPAEKLVKLTIGSPLDLQEDETATLIRRIGGATAGGGTLGGTPCGEPAFGRLWLDAVRGLLGSAREERFFEHAEGCPRCTEALLCFWRVPGLLEEGSLLHTAAEEASPPPNDRSQEDATPLPPPAPPPSSHSFGPESPQSPSAAEAQGPGQIQDQEQVQDQGPTKEQDHAQARDEDTDATETTTAGTDGGRKRPPPSSQSPVMIQPPLSALRPIHWAFFSLVLAAALVAGTFFGIYLSRR